MLAIILNILKIIGIILLVVLALILLILLVLLLVPVRYSFEAAKPRKPDFRIEAGLTWLIRTIRVRVRANRKGYRFGVWIFGRYFMGNDPKDKLAREEKKITKLKKQQEKEKKKAGGQKEETLAQEEEKNEKPEEVLEVPETSEAPEIPEAPETLEVPETPEEAEISPDLSEETGIEEEESFQDETDKKPFSDRLWDKAELIIKKLETLIGQIQKKADEAAEFKAKIDAMPIRHYISFGLDLVKRGLRHIRPRKLEGTVDFGFEDDYRTGQVTGYAAAVYPLYGDHVKVTPHFGEKLLTGDLKGSGRVRLGFFVWQLIRILWDKDMRALFFKLVKGE